MARDTSAKCNLVPLTVVSLAGRKITVVESLKLSLKSRQMS